MRLPFTGTVPYYTYISLSTVTWAVPIVQRKDHIGWTTVINLCEWWLTVISINIIVLCGSYQIKLFPPRGKWTKLDLYLVQWYYVEPVIACTGYCAVPYGTIHDSDVLDFVIFWHVSDGCCFHKIEIVSLLAFEAFRGLDGSCFVSCFFNIVEGRHCTDKEF